MTPFHLYLYGASRGPIASSFEEAEERLTQLPLLYFEPDGSFVWTRDAGNQKVYGMLYDAQEQIQYCEVRGQCDRQTWTMLCEAIAGDAGEALEVLLLPDRQLQDLQSFTKSLGPPKA